MFPLGESLDNIIIAQSQNYTRTLTSIDANVRLTSWNTFFIQNQDFI